ncbi:glycosyltransferase family 2 protein [Kaistella sp.]|uniref:glycosyltransferase family 2 protein n=1 Tax=Kaistella sp. TaxID=2782235 RepID=UPI002F9344B5
MFSVIIPYYKKRKYIERCLDAVLNQTFKDYEIIVIDDGSNDDIAELLAQNYSGKVTLIQQQNQGVSAARNAGIAAATHDYIAFLDADDYWSPLYLEKMAEVIHQEQNIKIIGSHYSRIKAKIETENKKLDYFLIKEYFKNALRNMYFFTSATVISKRFFESEAGFNPILKSGEDIDVWFRAVASGGNAYYIRNTLVYYSDEDENQLTVAPKNYQNRFFANIETLYFNENKVDNKDFYEFLSKFIYSSLYHFKYEKDTEKESNHIKNIITNKFFFAELYYLIPFRIGNYLLKNNTFKKLTRRYFKFIFRYLHT